MIIRVTMLCLLLISTAAAESSGAQRADQVAASLVGKPAPALQLRGIGGDTIDVSSYRGKQAVYLKFWATWCNPCMEQMPHFQHAYENAGPNLAVIGINAGFNDTPAAIKEFQRKLGITMPMAIDDGSAAAALNLRVTPMHVIIDRAGIVRFVGHLADARVDQALRAVKSPAPLSDEGKSTQSASTSKFPQKYLAGSRVQPLQLRPLDTRTALKLPASSGRPTVLVFVAAWCESYLADTRPQMSAQCKRSREQLTAVPAALRDQADWVWIASGIWTDEASLRVYRDSFGIKSPLVLDTSTTIFNAFDVRDVPAVVVIGGDGVIRQRLHGDEKDLQQRLLNALAVPAKGAGAGAGMK